MITDHPKDINFSDKEKNKILEIRKTVTKKVHEYIVGNNELIDLILVALFSQGHILIEGGPGTAKTTIAKIISLIIGCDFKRIQGAVDIQPADMIGVQVFDPKNQSFQLRKGPIFTNFLLIDELNRINPKSQSAFIEALSERQVTIDGIIYSLPSPFIVFATQNPYEMQGTFPLIEVQKDRFAYSTMTTYLNADDELQVIKRASTGDLSWEDYSRKISQVLNQEDLLNLIRSVANISIEDPVHRYIRDIIIATRNHNDIALGASSRASIAIVNGVKSLAALQGRKYVIPDDVKWLAPYVLLHRIYLTRASEVDGLKVGEIISEILNTIEVP